MATATTHCRRRAALVALCVLAALCCLTYVPAAAAAGLKVDPASQAFIDSDGRVRVFHGLNAVYKEAPYYPVLDHYDPLTSLAEEDMENLQKWGFNMIRLGVMWHPVAPTGPGEYNTTYLNIVRGITDKLAEYDVWTLVDSHEDCLSRYFCGEGFPDWAVEQMMNGTQNSEWTRFPSPLFWADVGHDGKYPNYTKCQENFFVEFHFTIATGTVWYSFYHMDAIQQAFAGYWQAVARAFESSDHVVGYELLNEPWPGDVYKNPLWFLETGKDDRENLAPLYKKVYEAIRQVDNDTIVVYEPNVATGYINQRFGFESGPGGPEANDKQVLAYHLYCESQNKTGDPKNITSCNDKINKLFGLAMESSKAIGGGSMISEFGALGNHTTSAEAINFLTGLADTQLQSWAYWTFKSFKDVTTQNSATETLYNPDGSIQTEKLRALSRTYAQAIAARPGSVVMSFDADSAAFDLSYLTNGAATAPTIIYLNEEMHYPRGFNVSVEPEGVAKVVHTKTNQLTVAPLTSSGTIPNNVLLRITVRAS